MADKQLTEDRVQAEQLKDQLVMLRDSRAFSLYSQQMADRLSRDQRLLEAELQPVKLYRLQGSLEARKDCMRLIEELISRIDNEHKQHQLKEEAEDKHDSTRKHVTLGT